MKFNNSKSVAPEKKEVFFILISVILLITLIVVLVIKNSFDKTTEAISVVALIVAVLSLLLNVSKNVFASLTSAKQSINLDIVKEEKFVIIECSIENNGHKRIKPQNVYVFIENGNEQKDRVQFPFLLKHNAEDCDCALSKVCKEGATSFINHTSYKGYKFEHLSCESIQFIDPGEKFNDSISLVLDKGAYRAIVIAALIKGDCICNVKNFAV